MVWGSQPARRGRGAGRGRRQKARRMGAFHRRQKRADGDCSATPAERSCVSAPDLVILQTLLERFETSQQFSTFSQQRLQRGTPLIGLPLLFDNLSLHLL